MATNSNFVVKNGLTVNTTAVIDSTGAWVGPGTNITGAQGVPGAPGAQGVVGIQGAQGTVGAQGVIGAQGLAGVIGTTGAQGVQGAQGLAGVVGAQGAQGAVGAQGVAGVIGTTGAQGVQGAQGLAGVVGAQGAQGTVGAQGVPGVAGTLGAQGVQGAVGAQGRQGVAGAQGPAGVAGAQGSKPLATASLINTSTWAAGQTSSVSGYSANETTGTENARVNDTDPWSATSVVWETRASGDGNNDGGWNTDYFSIDNTKTYRFSVWMRRTSTSSGGTFYFGLYGNGPTFGVNRNDGGGTEGNPYWECSGTSRYTQNQWYLVTGHCYGYNSSYPVKHGESGIYTIAGGTTKVLETNNCNIGGDVRWLSTTTTALHRAYHFYCSDNTTRLQFAFPRVDVIDGTEPTIAELLRASSGLFKSGTRGPQGAQGAVGAQGTDGAQGAQGSPGVQGAQGSPGAQGVQGAGGATGLTGTAGTTGAQGPQGQPGFQGLAGAQGTSGPTGYQGATGYAAYNPGGVQGPTGPTGVPGFQGTTSGGPPGFPGFVNASNSRLGVGLDPSASGVSLGEIWATQGISAFYSDIRLKDNIETIKNPGEKLYSLNGIFYTQNELAEKYGYTNNKRQVGVIAQEVQKVLPEVVIQAPFDMGKDFVSLSGENYLTVQYEKIIPLIIETIKEQQREIDSLKEQLK